MNRHHPYGDSPMARRGGSPPGPGPERTHRFSDYRGGPPTRGRGYGRGRGGSGGGAGGGGGYGYYDNINYGAYDQGPPQGDMGYSRNAPQDPYYQSNYDAGPSAPYPAAPSAGYSQGYPKYEGALENLRLNVIVVAAGTFSCRTCKVKAHGYLANRLSSLSPKANLFCATLSMTRMMSTCCPACKPGRR